MRDICRLAGSLTELILVSDEDRPYNAVRYWFDEVLAELKTDGYLLMEDPSLMLIRNFSKGREYLSSEWTDELNCDKRIHIIYLAVKPSMRHHGITDRLLGAVTEYADAHGLCSLSKRTIRQTLICTGISATVFTEL